MIVLLRIRMLRWFVLILTLYAPLVFPMVEVQQESLLCRVPQNVLCLVAEYLGSWKEINKLASTCRELDGRVTVVAKEMFIDLDDKRGNGSCRVFLDQVLHLLKRIGVRNGFNPISINLSRNRLGDDKLALQNFFACCAQEPIGKSLKELNLWHNNLGVLPSSISQLKYLELLDIGYNKLTDEAVEKVAHLGLLNRLVLQGNYINNIHPSILNLQKLTQLFLHGNGIRKDALLHIAGLKNLKLLNVSETSLTIGDLARSFATWPSQLLIKANNLEFGDNSGVLIKQFCSTSQATIDNMTD